MAHHRNKAQRQAVEPPNLYPPCYKCIEMPENIGYRCKKGRKTPRKAGCVHYDDGIRKGWVG